MRLSCFFHEAVSLLPIRRKEVMDVGGRRWIMAQSENPLGLHDSPQASQAEEMRH